jgi:hypothetical protein
MKSIICGTARNIEKYWNDTLNSIDKIINSLEDYFFIIVESNSNDKTLDILNNWSDNNKDRRKIISLGNINEPSRIKRIAKCRNAYLDYIKYKGLFSKYDYMIVIDLDDCLHIEDNFKEQLNSCFIRNDWDAIASNRKDYYYDIYALRSEELGCTFNCWKMVYDRNLKKYKCPKSSEIISLKTINDRLQCFVGRFQIKIDKWIKCESAFGGMVIYKTDKIKNNSYKVSNTYNESNENYEDCEHVSFNKGLRILINPDLISGGNLEEHLVCNEYYLEKYGTNMIKYKNRMNIISNKNIFTINNMDNKYKNEYINDFMVVVARNKNEDINWLSQFHPDNVIIYTKEEELSDYKTIKLSNIGGETYAYFRYIVDNYDNLPETTFFTQADYNSVISEGNQALTEGKQCLTEGKQCLTRGELCLTEGKQCLTRGELCLTEGKQCLTGGEQCLTDDILKNNQIVIDKDKIINISHISLNFQYTPIDNGLLNGRLYFYKNKLNPIKKNEKELNIYEWSRLFLGYQFKHIYTIIGSCFSIRKQCILSRPLSFYKQILLQLEEGGNAPEVGYFIERMWIAIFKINQNIFKSLEKEEKIKINTEDRNIFLYWIGKEYVLINILRKLIYLHSTNGKGYKVHLITHKNITNYLSSIPHYFYNLSPAHQADYIRVNVICKYGGIWLDSDTLVLDSLDSLFDIVENKNGFFIRENNIRLCNGVFGSKPNTELLIEWKNQMIKILEKKHNNIEWMEIGNSILENMFNLNPNLFDNYKIFLGLDNIYPVNCVYCVEEYINKPYENYKTIIRDYQPLIILVNSVYKCLENRYINENDIINGNMALSYFIKKSLVGLQKDSSA